MKFGHNTKGPRFVILAISFVGLLVVGIIATTLVSVSALQPDKFGKCPPGYVKTGDYCLKLPYDPGNNNVSPTRDIGRSSMGSTGSGTVQK